MEQLEGTVTMPLITYQKMRNDTSHIFKFRTELTMILRIRRKGFGSA